MRLIREACVETLAQCMTAEQKGADRLELCADLHLDGLTPSIALIKKVQAQVNIPIRVMIRPRAGDFNYSATELATMKQSISECKLLGVDGVVFGVCKGGALDLDAIGELAEVSQPLKVVIHKAIDTCDDPLAELQKLMELGKIDGILTSGKGKTAFEGMVLLRQMQALAGDKLELIACGKVTDQNLKALSKQLPVRAWHGRLIAGELG